eukprot:6715286-Prymnesium_polylepis.1
MLFSNVSCQRTRSGALEVRYVTCFPRPGRAWGGPRCLCVCATAALCHLAYLAYCRQPTPRAA